MRKTITILWCVTIFLYASAQEQELEVASKIKQVTVYLEGAQVSRHARVNLQPGVTALTLTNISPGIQENSIQVEQLQEFKILSVSFRINHLQKLPAPEKILALEAERRRILAIVAKEKSIKDVYEEEEVILQTNRKIAGTSKGLDAAELKAAMDYFRQRWMNIKEGILEADRNIRRNNEEIGKIEAELTELNNTKPKPSGEITIRVSSKTASVANMVVKYLVKDASWIPSYDLRVKNIQSPVAIAYKANVAQQSGEDWENVELTVSSGNPNKGGSKPTILPWVLGFNNGRQESQKVATALQGIVPGTAISSGVLTGRITDAKGDPVPGANVMLKGTAVGTVSDVEGFYSIPVSTNDQSIIVSFIGYGTQEVSIHGQHRADVMLSGEATQLSEVVVTGYGAQMKRDITSSVSSVRIRGIGAIRKADAFDLATPVLRQTNVEFKINELITLKSDGERRATEMIEYEVDALYEYHCVPKMDVDAFLVARLVGWDAYNFLQGEASLFFEGKYVGKSTLDARNTSDTLSLSLGRDGNVVVKREKKEDLSSRQFVGANRKIALAYEISVRNKKAEPLTIVIEDQIPVPNTKEIDVDKIDDSNAEYEPVTGLLKWRKVIEPGKTETIALRYNIRYPKYSELILE